MSHLIVIADIVTLDTSLIGNSSSKYVIGLVTALSKKVRKVTVISSICKKEINDGNIEIVSCETTKIWNYSNLYKFIKDMTIDKNEDITFLIWGYNPALLMYVHKIRKIGRVFSIIYDSHIGALEGKGFIEKKSKDLYYKIGLLMINQLNGVISFNQDAERALNLRVPFCYTLPGIDIPKQRIETKKKEQLIYLYAGTLCEYNLTRQLIQAFKAFSNVNELLYIYGDGPLYDYTREESENFDRIFCMGRVNQRELSLKMQDADILICLRDTNSPVFSYSFPSKLPEYMTYQKPIMASRLMKAQEFEDSVFLVNGNTEGDIAECIKLIRLSQNKFEQKIQKAEEYLNKYHNWQSISDKMYRFMFVNKQS